MKSISPCVRRAQTFLIALLASSAVFTAGCANMATTAVGSSSDAVALGGTIHGGNNPVSGATVQLWFAGQTGPAVLAATTTSSNNGAGSFSFAAGSYTCPVQSNSPYVYVTAYGGNTQGSGTHSNGAAVFLAPYGICTTLSASSFVDMTEATTVATMAALQQYFVSASATTGTYTGTGGYFRSSGGGLSYQAMGIAFNTIQNMVDLPTGTAISPITGKTINGDSGGVGSGGTSIVATPESAKINTAANILAACVNYPDYTIPTTPPTNNANACDTLFANAAPPASASTTAQPGATFTPATNTLQAAYYMLSNPTNGSATNLGNLFDLIAAAGAPFQPSLGTAPSDWTIAISYASSSQCGGANSSTGGHLIHSVQDIAVDANGNIWLANNESTGALTALEAVDGGQAFVPAACVPIGSGKNTGITIDALAGASGLANIWLADSGGSNVYKYQPNSAAATAFATSSAPASIAADGAGNIYYSVPSSTSLTTSTLYEITGGNGTTPLGPFSIYTGIGTGSRVIVDSAPSIWTTSGANSVAHTVCTTPDTATGCTTTTIAPTGPTYGVAASAFYTPLASTLRNSIFVSQDGTSDSVTLYQGIGTTYNQVTNWPVTGLSNPAAVAADGAQNVWTVNNLNNANSVFEVGLGQQALSPAAGFQKTAAFLGSARSLAIDSSGNVWIGLDGANSVTEIVGAAVPVVQPFSAGLKGGSFQTIP